MQLFCGRRLNPIWKNVNDLFAEGFVKLLHYALVGERRVFSLEQFVIRVGFAGTSQQYIRAS